MPQNLGIPLKVRHAKLLDVNGRPAKSGDWTFVPANVELDGAMFEPSYHLNKMPPDRIPPVLRVPIEQQYDVAWVRARLPSAFGLTPEPTEVEKALLSVGFVVVRERAAEGIAFLLTDYYGKTSLTFSEAESDEQITREIAHAFWGVLLSEPDDLADFEAKVFHPGAGVWLNFGCARGEPYCFESPA